METQQTTQKQTPSKQHTHIAGAFDIRNFIGVLIGIYGIVLLGCGLFGDTPDGELKHLSDNLWAGGIMLAAGVIFMLWAKLRPVVIVEEVEEEE